MGFSGEAQSTNTLIQVSDIKADSSVRIDPRLQQSAVMAILRYGVHLGREPRSSLDLKPNPQLADFLLFWAAYARISFLALAFQNRLLTRRPNGKIYCRYPILHL